MPGDYEGFAQAGPFNWNLAFPGPDASPEQIIDYRNKVYSKYAAYRRRIEMRLAVDYQYWIDNQWLTYSSVALPNGQLGYSLRLLDSDSDSLPRPVTNILAPNCEIELATYNKRQFMPKAVAASTDPWDIDVANRMTSVLRHRARELNWQIIRQRTGLNLIIGGTAAVRTWWDQSFFDVETIASPFAKECVGCGARLASSEIPLEMAKEKTRFNSDSLGSIPTDPLSVMVSNCPACDSRGTLQPAQLNEADLDALDFYGRRLGVEVPRGEIGMESLDGFSLYPENGGVGVSYDNFRVMHTVVARSLDWIAERHPQFASEIRAETQTELLRRNPMLGEFASYGWWTGPSVDSNIYAHHANYYEMVALPNWRMPKGAVIRSCNNLVLEVSPLLWDYTDSRTGRKRSIQRVSYACGVWQERPGEFFGHSMFDRGRSIQNRLNGRDAQITDIHERLANPHIMAASDMNLTGPEWYAGQYSGKRMIYDRSPLAPEDKPMVFGGQSPPSGVWQERDRLMSDGRFVLGPAEIETGNAPKNVTTSSGLHLASENAEQRRSPREGALDFISQKTWTAVMEMEQGFRVSSSEYQEEDPKTKAWRTEVYDRSKLAASLRLEIEKTAFVARSIYDREAAREAQADGLYVVTKPADRKRLLELRGLPADVNADENFQVDAANAKWANFVRDSVVPVLDPTLDNAAIHWDVMSAWLLSEDGKRLARMANWEFIVPQLTDWEQLLQQRIQLDQLSRQTYGMWISEEEARQAYAQAKLEYDAAAADYPMQVQQYDMQALAAARGGTQLTEPPPLQPVEPLVPVFLPRPLDKKILTVWKELLDKVDVPVVGGDPLLFQEIMNRFLRYRAVVEAYRLTATGAIQPAAPPVPATPPGVVPNPANPPNPTNVPSPGSSQALSNANMAATGPGTVAGG